MGIHYFCLSLLMVLLSQLSAAGLPVASTLSDTHLNQLIEQADAITISESLRAGQITSLALTQAYLSRIEKLNPIYKAVISINPKALDQARDIDSRRLTGQPMHAIAGIPVLIKDNIDVSELPTTAGSLALADNYTARDAAIVTNLRSNGAIILGKTNLSEWANFRSERSSSGWSAVGGQTRNPYDLSRSPCGSSSGSAVAVAVRLTPLAVGTETNGSVVCPANVNGLVGFKPSIGILPQTGIIPIAHSQDTAGPIANNVASTNLLFNAMRITDASHPLKPRKLQDKRIGVIRSATGYLPELDKLFQKSLNLLEQNGVILIDGLALKPSYPNFRADSYLILLWEFKQDLKHYFEGLDNPLSTLDLNGLIAFNKSQPEKELALFPQDIFERAAALTAKHKTKYQAALSRAQNETRNSIRALIRSHRLDAIVAPTGAPAWSIDYVNGDDFLGGFSTYPAVSGYPHITLPMGLISGLPVGLSISAIQDQDQALINLAAAIEKMLGVKVAPYLPEVD